MAKARKDNKGRALRKGESQRSQDGRYVYTYKNPLGKRGYVYATTLQELREKEDKLIRDQLDGLDLYVAGKADLNFAVDRYLATKNNLATSTYANYRYMYDLFCKDGFGKRKVAEIKYSDVLHFYLYLVEEKKIKVKTVESLHCVLHPAFDMAVRDSIIRNNPSDGVISEIKKRQGRKQKVERALTLEQQVELLHYITDHPLYDYWRPLFTFLLGTGCRIGEACGLRWQDVDLENRVIDINHSMTYFRRGKQAPYTFEFKFEPPKTKAGNRKIPMLDEVYDVLMELYEQQKKEGFSPLVVDGATGFIFINKVGTLYKHNAIDHSIKRIVNNHNAEELVKAKQENRDPILLPFFSCHTFRHTFCTRYCENETNVKVIQAVMGHADINTTMDIYAEVTEATKRKSMENLSKNLKVF